MFTVEQIMQAHAKVQSGADFPSFIQDLKKLGITSYETFVSDGHADYVGKDDRKISSTPKYAQLHVTDVADNVQFQSDLKAHQQGKTNYTTFCEDAAKSGVEKWVVYIENMTCTYYNKSGNKMLEETIPG